MNNIKVTIRIASVIVLIACLALLSFAFVAGSIESKADVYAGSSVNIAQPAGLNAAQLSAFKDSVQILKWQCRQHYLDSVADIPIVEVWFLKKIYTYRFCHVHTLHLMDEQGCNVNMVVAVNEGDFLRTKSGNNADAMFNAAIRNADSLQAVSGTDFFTSFQQTFEKLNPNGKLAEIFCKASSYRGRIDCSLPNSEVISLLRDDVNAESEEVFVVLRNRIDQYGAASPHLIRSVKTGQSTIDLHGVDNPLRICRLLLRPAHLQLYNTYETSEVITFLADANAKLRTMPAAIQVVQNSSPVAPQHTQRDPLAEMLDTSSTDNADTITNQQSISTQNVGDIKANPLFSVLYPNITSDGQPAHGPMVGLARPQDTAAIDTLLGFAEVRAAFSPDVKLLWGANPIIQATGKSLFGLYAIKQAPSLPDAPINGDDVTDAWSSYDQSGLPMVDIAMSKSGADIWEQMTEAASNAEINGMPIHRNIAIVLDGRVISAPRVMQKIVGGRSQITGIIEKTDADDLANVLRSGRLKTNLRLVSYHFTVPSNSQLGNMWVFLAVIVVLIGLFVIVFRSTA